MSQKNDQVTKRAIVNYGKDLEWFDTMPGEQMAIRISSHQLGGAIASVEARVPVLSGPPKHYHNEREEIFEILEGTFRFQVGDEEFDATSGTSVVVPRGVTHTWANVGFEMGRILFTFAPGGSIDEFFPLIAATPPEGWSELAKSYDTEIVGPPMYFGKQLIV